MSRAILLDAGPLGMVTHPGGVAEVDSCKEWFRGSLGQGERFVVPEIADYEVRRELLRAGKSRSLDRLDSLIDALEYLPLSTAAMRRAAELWADTRRRGQPTADPKALDADVILAAQGLTMGEADSEVVVVTTNVGHLARLISAQHWRDLSLPREE